MHNKMRRIVPVLLITVLAVFAWWYFTQQKATANSGVLQASGTIEATQITISPELSGKIVEVLVVEGQKVTAGDLLVRLDTELLTAQLQQAQAALETAKANYALVAAGPTSEQRQLAIAQAEAELLQAQHALDDIQENASLAAAQALHAVAIADKALDQAGDHYAVISGTADQADIDAAHATMVMAKDRLEKAQEDFKPYEKKAEDNLTRAAFQAKLSSAQITYDNAVTRYNNLVGRANQYELAVADTTQILAAEQLAEAQREYEKVKDGPDPDLLNLAEARVTMANAALEAARAEPSAEALAVAQAQVEAAQAALNVLQTQLAKLSIYASQDGVVLARSAEPGENVLPGAPLLTLADIDQLTITVYVPEDRYGQLVLGETAKLKVDSYPGEEFVATIVQIADQAEFTPRNVQTAEGRSTTVFAVKLRVNNLESKLKPGMPADIVFER